MSAAAAMSATLVSWMPFFASTPTAAARISRRVRSRRRSTRFAGATRSDEALFINEWRFTTVVLRLCQAPPACEEVGRDRAPSVADSTPRRSDGIALQARGGAAEDRAE